MGMSVESHLSRRYAQGAPKPFPTQVLESLSAKNQRMALHYPQTVRDMAEFLVVGHDLLYGSFTKTNGVMATTHFRDVWAGRRNLLAIDILRMSRAENDEAREAAKAFARRLEFDGQSIREPLESLLAVLQRARRDPQFSER
jgi:hypothetical protein